MPKIPDKPRLSIHREELLPSAPSDADCEAAYEEIMRLAEKHCLIVQAYGGVAVISIPREQRLNNIREMILRSHKRSEPEDA